MSKQQEQEPIQPNAADFEEASLEWSKMHGKTDEQMQHRTDPETAECYLLARDYARMRRWKTPKAQDKAKRPRHD